MSRCSSCSAPLPANSNQCLYCQVRSDVDLRNKHQYVVVNKSSVRICPECDIPLATIDLHINGNFQIERCNKCFGMFFDPGEIEDFLDNSVTGVFTINTKHMRNINRDRYQKEKAIRYRKCPECREFMQRSNYAHRSGVVIDRCAVHGIWIDSGEVTHLMEWKKAGGEILHKKVAKENKAMDNSRTFKKSLHSRNYKLPQKNQQSFDITDDLLNSLSHLFHQLF